MHIACNIQLMVVAHLAAVAIGQWFYTWPYKEDGSCDCTFNTTRPKSDFASQEECLQAFALEDLEYCRHQELGIVQQQCVNAVSTEEGYLNGACASLCTRLVAGVISTADFTEVCEFEFVIPFDDSVAVLPDSCFSNYVYGWSDYDVNSRVQTPPLRILQDVPSPAKCQELCQSVPECVLFNWRAMPEAVSNLDGFQNPPQTCILYDRSYLDGVFSHTTSLGPTPYCDTNEIGECANPPWEQTDHFNLFDEYYCLTCGCKPQCAWLSETHISGPAFCQSTIERDPCHYDRPTWTSTLAPCEEPTTTEPSEIGGTAETDFVRLYEADFEEKRPRDAMTSTESGSSTTVDLSYDETETSIELAMPDQHLRSESIVLQ